MAQPVHKISCGAIQVAVWENESVSKDGAVGVYNTVSFDKRYKAKDDTWKSSNSMRMSDIPKAILALQKAFEFLALKEKATAETE